MSRVSPRHDRGRPVGAEDGSISVLLIGYVAVALTVILAVVSVTSIQLSRIHLLDAADAAALDASDALADEVVYGDGLGSGVPITDATVVDAAAAHLAARERPSRLASWQLGPGTGTPDGRTAVVVMTGTARVPILSPVLATFGGGVSVTVTSTARSDLL